jgi:pre-mRNA-splicing factor ISY1
LGGADYKKESLRFYDAAGVELPGSGGYKYFGAAKDLPGVRELFQRTVPNAPR